MSNIPPQYRAVDPFSSKDSNIVSAITRIVTDSSNCISNSYPIEVTLDSTTPTEKIILNHGMAFKDDILIQLTTNFTVDFTNSDFYNTSSVFNEVGYYYVVMEYGYAIVSPAPQAGIKIIKPSERAAFNYSQHIMLKVVSVILNGSTYEIDALYDYDPENLTNEIHWTHNHAAKVPYVPNTFDVEFDVGKLIIDRRNSIYYIGTYDGWREFGVYDYPCNTSGCAYGEAVYIDSSNVAIPAIATDQTSLAYGYVIRVGDDHHGVVRFSGRIIAGLLEDSVIAAEGDYLYLSSIQPGRATNMAPDCGDGTTYFQGIGRCMNVDNTNGTFDSILTYLGTAMKSFPHNLLLGIQGGDSSGVYHLTYELLTKLENSGDGITDHNDLQSIQGGDGTNYYHLSEFQYNNLALGGIDGTGITDHSLLSNLRPADGSPWYHLNTTLYYKVLNGTFNHDSLSGLKGTGTYHVTAEQLSQIGIIPPFFASGTKLMFPQPTPPIGWTLYTLVHDKVVRIVNDVGGVSGGSSWTITGLSVPTHYHDTSSHTLTESEIPPHTHTFRGHFSYGLADGPHNAGAVGTTENTGSTGGGQGHGHGQTSTTTLPITSDGNWRPAYFDVIIAVKD